MRKMKIMILCAQGGVAGSTYSISYLANGLANKGHDVYLGLIEDSFLDELVDGEIVNKTYLKFNGKLDRATRDKVRQIINEKDIQIVNAQSSNDRYLAPIINLTNKRKVVVIQTRRQKPKDMTNINQYFQNIFNNYFSDYLVTVSHALKSIFIERGIRESKIQVIHNGTPTEQYKKDEHLYNKLKVQLGFSPEDIVIGCTARYKNQPQLVKALQFLPSEWKVLYIGLDVESYRARFPNEPDILAVPQEVKCLGIIANKAEVLQYYRIMRVNVLPSTMDGFGLTLVESMAMGTPVVATNYAGIKDVVIHEENGLLYENEACEEFAQQIHRAATDLLLREKIIAAGKITAFETFSIKNTIEKYENFFLSIIKEN
ncbi:MAG: glycosyltransferase involved in cell wall biosynthesis [Marivirga sp.]|jgi:glycosyltransferase involved in cell wall biosynthesis